MEKYKVINKDFFPDPKMVIEKKGDTDNLIATAAESIKEMYKHFYPDTTVVRLDADHDLDAREIDDIVESFDETLGKNKQRLRIVFEFHRTVLIFASAKFKKVAEKMKEGDCVVEYHNPFLPSYKRTQHEVMSAGVYYKDGYAYIDVRSMDNDEAWDEEKNDWCIGQAFAIYWRPVEEKM